MSLIYDDTNLKECDDKGYNSLIIACYNNRLEGCTIADSQAYLEPNFSDNFNKADLGITAKGAAVINLEVE